MNANTVHDPSCMRIAMSDNTAPVGEMASRRTNSTRATWASSESIPAAFFVSSTMRSSDLQKTLAILDEVLNLLEDTDDYVEDSQ